MMNTALLLGAIGLAVASQVRGEEPKKPSFPVPLNHVYVVLDPATYKAIESSDFLRGQFAPSEIRTTVRTDMSYSGLYFYGTNTYFEFFDAANSAVGGLGASGIAFGVEQPGALQSLVNEQPNRFEVGPQPITRQFKDSQVPWFFMGIPKAPAFPGFQTWIMEYHPRFLAEWNPVEGKQNQGISRKALLERYAAVLRSIPAQPYLQDVIGITINLDSATATQLIEMCQALGYLSKPEGTVTTLEGPDDFKLRVMVDATSAKGIREMVLRVSREPEQKEIPLGKSLLKFLGGGQATWTFQ